VRELADGRRLIDASMSVDDFNQEFGVAIASEEAETLAGVLLDAFGELPACGRGDRSLRTEVHRGHDRA
jgi:Mg2+/Co2+ transporter CorC